MPNIVAYVVLFSFPFVAFVLFRKLSIRSALIYTILCGYLFLPDRTGFDLPLIPAVDKKLLPSLVAFVLCALVVSETKAQARLLQRRGPKVAAAPDDAAPDPAPAAAARGLSQAGFISARARAKTAPVVAAPVEDTIVPTRSRWITAIVAVCLISPLLTVMTNGETLYYGPKALPRLTLSDGYTMIVTMLVTLMPFFLGRKFLGAPSSHQLLLKILCYLALVMSVLIVIEVRLSPQLNIWIYGFMPHSFHQHVRAGGYRPMLFLPHGLWVGIAIAMAFVAALTLFKTATGASRFRWMMISGWLFVTLVMCKTIGALGLGIVLGGAVLFLPRRGQLLVVGVFAGIVALYPMLRSTGLAPVQQVAEITRSYSADRAQSFEFRLQNEDVLLARANEKPLTGWGIWGRPSIFDPETGEQTSVVDGSWVIIMGVHGWIGYLSQFGLLCLPLIVLAISLRKGGIPAVTTGLAVVLAVNLVDLIPNATLTPLTWLLAGALAGYYDILNTRKAANLSPAMLRRQAALARPEWAARKGV